MIEYNIFNKNNIHLNIIEGCYINNINAIVINVHGIGSHFQDIEECIDTMTVRENILKKNNIKCFAFEFHGHGKSGGQRCSFDSFDDLVDDMLYVVIYIKNKYPNIPIFVVAESMGGAVAIRYNIKYNKMYKINGYILISPMVDIYNNLYSKLYKNFVFNNIIEMVSYKYPTVPLIPTNKKNIINNEQYMMMRKKNKYIYHDKFRLNVIRECYYIIIWVKKNGHLFNSPLFVIHGLKDIITDPQSSINFWKKAQTPKKHIYLPKDADHGIFIGNDNNDQHPKLVWEKIIDWINKN